MLTSFSVKCPYETCAWTGSLLPSVLKGGDGAEIARDTGPGSSARAVSATGECRSPMTGLSFLQQRRSKDKGA